MAANGHHQNGGRTILVLYRITNSDSDSSDPLFNCFQMPFGRGPTLNSVKHAAHSLNQLGPEGYHWRVLVEDKPVAGTSDRNYSWWDIQDGNAKLPVKETSAYDLRKLLHPSKPAITPSDTAAKAAKGAFKMMNKMATVVTGEDLVGTADQGPPVAVLTFKLLDLMKAADDVNSRNTAGVAAPVVPRTAPRPPRTHAAQPRAAPVRQSAPPPQTHGYQAPPQQHAAQAARRPQAPAPVAEANLMDFGGSPQRNPKVLHHALSSPLPTMAGAKKPSGPPLSRVEQLKQERIVREQKMAHKRVWDPIDERWVEVEPGTAPPGHKMAGMEAVSKVKVVGIKLDGSSAIGKSAYVAQEVGKRVADMESEQAKKVNELREREAKKKSDEEQEDIIRKQLDPKIKEWSEEHGKKKQLRALLASLHTVLWPGAQWKQLTIGDLLDDGKVKRAFFKASLVVHPDKTHDLPLEHRFLAKRIFDSLSQAKADFDGAAN